MISRSPFPAFMLCCSVCSLLNKTFHTANNDSEIQIACSLKYIKKNESYFFVCVNPSKIMGLVWTCGCNLLLKDKSVKRIRIFWSPPFFFFLLIDNFSGICPVLGLFLLQHIHNQNCTNIYSHVKRAPMKIKVICTWKTKAHIIQSKQINHGRCFSILLWESHGN